MAALKNKITETEPLYFHIYRDDTQNEIFVDNNDFQTFVKYLKDYFSDTTEIEGARKTFTIRGHHYQGIPHQSQNFFNQIELLAYKLEPNRFDLLIKQIVPGALEKFIRALSTRYALYFNKKHHRSGALFKDSYKSINIKDLSSLLHLTRDLHSNFSKKVGVPDNYYSSYPEYLGQRVSKWIKTQYILSKEGVSDNKSFVEGGKSEKTTYELTSPPKPKPRILEIILAFEILILFSSYSLIKIQIFKSQSNNLDKSVPIPSPQVSGVGDVKPEIEGLQPEPLPTEVSSGNQEAPETKDQKPEVKTIAIIKITDGAENVNLHRQPSTESEVIGKANSGETFELISEYPGWYEIKLDDSRNAFVSAMYSEKVMEETQ